MSTSETQLTSPPVTDADLNTALRNRITVLEAQLEGDKILLKQADTRTSALTQQVEKAVKERNEMRDEHHGMILKCEAYREILNDIIKNIRR